MRTSWAVGLFLPLLPLLGGCADVAFKRGGSSADFDAARQTCHRTTSDDDAYRACLSNAGWSVVAEANANDAVRAQSSTPVAAASPSAAVSAPPAPVAVAATPVPPTPEPDPKTGLETIAVKNWWRIGVGSSSLDAAVDHCVARLGPAHQPEPGYHSVTRSLAACLKTEGWHAGN